MFWEIYRIVKHNNKYIKVKVSVTIISSKIAIQLEKYQDIHKSSIEYSRTSTREFSKSSPRRPRRQALILIIIFLGFIICLNLVFGNFYFFFVISIWFLPFDFFLINFFLINFQSSINSHSSPPTYPRPHKSPSLGHKLSCHNTSFYHFAYRMAAR